MGSNDNVVDFKRVKERRAKEQAANERALTVAGWKYKALCLKDRAQYKMKQDALLLKSAAKLAILKLARLTLLIGCYVGLFYSGFFAFYQFYKDFPDGLLPFVGFIALFAFLYVAKAGVKKGFDYLIPKG